MRKGSITIFASLSMMLIASFIFAMLESARFYGLQTYVKQKTPVITESVFAEYNSKLWEDYHLFFLDGAYGGSEFAIDKVEGRANQVADKNLNYKLISKVLGFNDLFQLNLEEVTVDSYELATDQEGDVFLAQVASYMKNNIPMETAQLIKERIQKGKEIETEGDDAEGKIAEAIDKAKDEETKKVKMSYSEESPIDFVKNLKRNTILGMVVEDVDKVSKQNILNVQTLSERTLLEGTRTETMGNDWYQKILLELYLQTYFSNYANEMEDHALSYELEYIVCGKKEDKANLDGVVTRLMLAREAANVIALVSDREKVSEAEVIATALAGFTGNPAVVKVVQIGIIGAWAYLESILDIRTLLQGGKISLLKSAEQWTTDITHIVSSFNSNAKAKECEDGLYYSEFLLQFLFFTSTKEQTYRAMDLMEANIRLVPGYANCKMDHMIIAADLSYRYTAEPLFWKLVTIGNNGKFSYQSRKSESFSYILN